MPLIILIFRDLQYLIVLKISHDCTNCAEGMKHNDSDHGSNNSEISPEVHTAAETLLGQRRLRSWAEIRPLGGIQLVSEILYISSVWRFRTKGDFSKNGRL